MQNEVLLNRDRLEAIGEWARQLSCNMTLCYHAIVDGDEWSKDIIDGALSFIRDQLDDLEDNINGLLGGA